VKDDGAGGLRPSLIMTQLFAITTPIAYML